MEDMILSVSTLPKPLHSRILSDRVRVQEENGVIILIPIINKDKALEKPHVRFVGVMSTDSYNEICEALEDTQKVDADEW